MTRSKWDIQAHLQGTSIYEIRPSKRPQLNCNVKFMHGGPVVLFQRGYSPGKFALLLKFRPTELPSLHPLLHPTCEGELQKTSVTVTPATVTIVYRDRFLVPKRTFSYRKSSVSVTIGFNDTFANPHQCHCNRSSTYLDTENRRRGTQHEFSKENTKFDTACRGTLPSPGTFVTLRREVVEHATLK